MSFNRVPAIRVTCIRTMCLFSFLDTQLLLQIGEYAFALMLVAILLVAILLIGIVLNVQQWTF